MTKEDTPLLNPHCSPPKWWIRFLQWQEVTVSNLAVEWSTQSQIEQTPTAVQWNIQMTKLNRHQQQCCEAYNITKTNCTDTNRHVCSEAYNYKTEQTCSSAVMHTILNITKSNCTDTYRHVCSEAYNYKIEQTPVAVLWSIQYHKVKLHRH